MPRLTTFTDEAWIALENLQDSLSGIVAPTIRLGVTGLARSGKTVFITSLIHNLLHGGRLPLFDAQSSGRIAKVELRPQPSMALPRFQYEEHINTLLDERAWPQSTRSISELRLTLNYESRSTWKRRFTPSTLNIDIVDYPGEWLLDLPLLGMSYAEWSRQALSLARFGKRAEYAKPWLDMVKNFNPNESADEGAARKLAALFTDYLKRCREDDAALSTLPPGRFLMPGDLDGSPALTFAPLDIEEWQPPRDSLHAMMQERFEGYKNVVVRPFFRDHFARLDRQIVLVDTLHAINAGHEALVDLETALTDILRCFKTGSSNPLAALVSRRIDGILFAATKADHVHHENHDRMEAVLEKLVGRAMTHARYQGASIDVVAMAAVRATREAIIKEGGENFPVIVGTPLKGEEIDGERFDGDTETAIFPGDLPEDPATLFQPGGEQPDEGQPVKFVRFKPPELEVTSSGVTRSLPQIRLDRALEFLLADDLA